jgi:hypothetical protein
MGSFGKVGEGFLERQRIRCLHKHECHGGTQKDDVG